MPVRKVDDKTWEVAGETYDSEDKANKAYEAIVALNFGVPKKKKKK